MRTSHVARLQPHRRAHRCRLRRERPAGEGEEGLGAVEPDERELRIGRDPRRRQRERQPARAGAQLEQPPRRPALDDVPPERQVEERVVGVLELVELRVAPRGTIHASRRRQRQRRGRRLAGYGLRPQRSEVGSDDQDDDDEQQPREQEHRLDASVEINTPADGKGDAQNAPDVQVLWSANSTAVQRLGHRVCEQQPVVHEREAVAEPTEREHHPAEARRKGGDGAD